MTHCGGGATIKLYMDEYGLRKYHLGMFKAGGSILSNYYIRTVHPSQSRRPSRIDSELWRSAEG